MNWEYWLTDKNVSLRILKKEHEKILLSVNYVIVYVS